MCTAVTNGDANVTQEDRESEDDENELSESERVLAVSSSPHCVFSGKSHKN